MQIKIEIAGLIAGILAPGANAVRIFIWSYSGIRYPELTLGWHLHGVIFGIFFITGLCALGYQVLNFFSGRRQLLGLRMSLSCLFLFLIAFTTGAP